MEPVEAHKIVYEHKTNQDRAIREKILGLFIGHSVLLAAFFMSMPNDNFAGFRFVVAASAIILCLGFGASLIGDIMTKWRTIERICEIEKASDFAYLKNLQSRPITDIELGVRYEGKYGWQAKIWDALWLMFPLLSIVAWSFALGAIWPWF